MVAVTYPGTVSPLRGLDPFGETERDVWGGREAERDDLAKLVTGDGFRAGLLYGEPGVGKTSLVRAGLIPNLRDHGIVALACDDLAQPAASFASGLAAFGIQPTANEQPSAFIQRAVSAAVAGQLFVFVIDDADVLCADERVAGELGDLFAKVVSRSAGRARFLFVAASERIHSLGVLERRTGSLFPPSARYELPRLSPAQAAPILDRVLSLSGVAADPALADAVVQGMARGGTLLAADLQIAAMAMRTRKISSLAMLQDAGGATELESLWLHDACKATGNERTGLRMCAELASSASPKPADHVIRRISLEPGFAQAAFATLESQGVIVRADPNGESWMLRHEMLAPRIRELTAPARAAARRAFDLLGSKTARHERLTLGEMRALKTEGIAPVTPDEESVVARSRRYYLTIAAGIAAVPVVLLIILYVAMHGRVFFALAPRAGGDHVVIESGRAGLSGFAWLPGIGYGHDVADTGLTRSMVAPEAWKKIEDHDLGATRGDWSDQVAGLMAPQLAGLVDYATSGSDATLAELRKDAKDPEDVAELLIALRPIARGTPGEIQLIEAALKSPQPAVQRAAVAAAGAAAQRRDVYQDQLVEALTAPDPELRRIAFGAVRTLGERGRALFTAALAKDPDATAKRELAVELAATSGASVGVVDDAAAPTPAAAIATLLDANASAPLKDRARQQLVSTLAKASDPASAAAATAAIDALGGLLGNDQAPPEARVFAATALWDADPLPKDPKLVAAARAAASSRSVAVHAAALPLYARLDPVPASDQLVPMIDNHQIDKALRVAAALAWGEVVAANKDAAANSLDKLLKDDDGDIRAAAAEAAGKLGRVYQDRLFKMAKNENYNVRIGAAMGLANTAIVGANYGIAVDGIAQLWNEKGTPRRSAAKVYTYLAKKKPTAVEYYLEAAAHTVEDPALHPMGAEGLCNGALAGSTDARNALKSLLADPAVEVRRIAMHCVADGPDPAKNGAFIAIKLAGDVDTEVRTGAARVLALAANGKGSKVAPAISDALVKMLDDPERDVRVIAVRAVGSLGTDAPKAAAATMARMFEHADVGEKLALLRAAKDIGAASDLVGLAVGDAAPEVRIAAIDAGLGSSRGEAVLSAALADPDPQVRRAALTKLGEPDTAKAISVDARDRVLALAARDSDAELSQLALTTIARVTADAAVVEKRLRRALSSRLEKERAQAAAATIGLVDRQAALAVQLLEPLLDDPSHDVRMAMLPSLAAAYAKVNDLEKLSDLMKDSEGQSMRRLVVGAAFVTLASSDKNVKQTEEVLGRIVDGGPPMASATAKLVAGLVAGKADGLAFLQELVP
nr:AAA family ATPase [Kofleriaceae bacterium]